MARLRTFIALDLGKPLRDRLVALQQNLTRAGCDDVKWVEPNNLHLTLLFLGEVDERDVLPICRAVSATAAKIPAFSLVVAGTGCFPNPRRPRVLWAGIEEGAAETVALHNALEEPLLDLGCYRREARAFTPHVTLGRLKGEGSDKLGPALAKHANWQGADTMIQEVHVMSSELTPHGPEYSVLSRGQLLS